MKIDRSIYYYPALIAFGAVVGTATYFLIPVEPSLMFLAVLSTFCLILFYFMRNNGRALPLLCIVTAGTLFCLNTAWQVQRMNGYFLPEDNDGERYWVTGQVAEIQSTPKRDKIVIAVPKVYGVDAPLDKVRISAYKGKFSEFKVSDHIAVEAVLHTPSSPGFDGDYDSRKASYLNGVSATGYVMGDIYRTSWSDGATPKDYAWQKFRQSIAERVWGEGSSARSVLVALIVGKKQFLERDIYDDFRKSGLAHLLAISGLHIGMIGGFAFFLVRALWARYGAADKIHWNKPVAAVCAFAVVSFYTALAGATLPTVRAFVMMGLLFLAVLARRHHVGLRVFFVAVLIILAMWPEALVTASFQLSFVAVGSLILWGTFVDKKFDYNKRSWLQRSGVYVQGVFYTSVVAGLATMPVAALHFHELTVLGFVLNILAIPLTAFVIMPLAFLGLLLMPLGLDALVWAVLSPVVDGLLAIAAWGGARDALHFAVPTVYGWGLLAVVSLLGLAVLIRHRVARAACVSGGVLVVVACVLWEAHVPLRILTIDNYVMAQKGGRIQVLDGPKYQRALPYLASRLGATVVDNLLSGECDTTGCVYSGEGVSVFVPQVTALEEDCRMVDLVIGSAPCFSLSREENASWEREEGAHVYKPALGRVWHSGL